MRASRALSSLLVLMVALVAGLATGQQRFQVTAVVEDAEHRPVSGALVQFERALGWPAIFRAITDESGAVEVRVPAGVYLVRVDSGEHPILWAGPVEVSAGEPNASAGRLTVGSGVRLVGRVLDRQGAPIEGARVSLPTYSLLNSDDKFVRMTMTNADGRFELPGLPTSESLQLSVWHSDYPHRGDRLGESDLRITLPRSSEGRAFAMHNIVLGDLAGTLVLDLGAIAADDASVFLDYGGPEPWSDVMLGERVPDPGPIVLDGLRPGPWHVTVMAAGATRAEFDVTIASGQVIERTVDSPGFHAAALVLVLDPDGRPASDVWISFASRAAGSTYRAATDDAGHARFERLPEGLANVSASLTRRQPGSERRFPGGSRYVLEKMRANATLDVGSTDAIEITLHRYAALVRFAFDGTVVDATGRPIVGARVQVKQPAIGPVAIGHTWSRAQSGPDGHFELADITEGVHDLRIFAPGFEPATRTMRVLGETPAVDLNVVVGSVNGGLADVPNTADQALFRVVGSAARRSGGGFPRYVSALDGLCRRRVAMGEMFADGRFVIERLAAGTWCVTVTWSDGVKVKRQVEVSDRDVQLTIGAEPSERYTITGRIRDATESARSVQLSPSDRSSLWEAPLDDWGRFEMDGLLAGTYKLSVRSTSWGWVLAERVIKVPSPDEIEIRVEIGVPRLSGTVRGVDGAPVPANVSLSPAPPVGEPERGADFGCCVTQAEDGAFEFERVPPGRWLLNARGRRAQDRGLFAGPVHLVVPAGSAPLVQDLQWQVIPGLTVRSRTPAPASLQLKLRDAYGLQQSGTLDAGESDLFLRAPAGRYTLTASNEFGYEHSLKVLVPGAELVLPEPERRGRIAALIPELFNSDVGLTLRLERGDTTHEVRVGAGATGRDADGAVQSGPLEPGEYNVRVVAKDGREWSAVAVVTAFAVTTVTLRSR